LFHILMLGFTQFTPAARPDHSACSGCSLCLLVCPVWRRTRDLTLTPHGRAKALQHGAGVADIAASIESCTLCGACEPACPEEINLVGMIVDLRRQLPRSPALQALHDRMDTAAARPVETRPASHNVLLSGAALSEQPATLARVAALLGSPVGEDDGADIALALEAGAVVSAPRLARFLEPLRRLKTIVVADGLLLHHLRDWLPRAKIVSLGAALSRLAAVRRGLRPTDLYVIEPRAYHANYEKLVTHYDNLRAETGCTMNLDLQRIAIPAATSSLPQRLGQEATTDGEQLRWLLKGQRVSRIVIENAEDRTAFEQVCALPIVHLAELADDETLPERRPS
jgi:ferredoxin